MLNAIRKLLTRKKKEEPSSFNGKIEVFVRHCSFSSISQHKKRLNGFSRELCHQNLLETMDRSKANLTFFFDAAKGDSSAHFLRHKPLVDPLVEIQEGTEAGSFLRLLEYVTQLGLLPETILYFVEDDYLHRPGWTDILLEGFQVPFVDYVTLYDHRDKYFAPMYQNLAARLFVTRSCHWRSTPSTTQTFAVRLKTLLSDIDIHRKYSKGRTISRDHAKFMHLQQRGSLLISSVPGWSTHAEPEFASPCIDWEKMFLKSVIC